MDNVVNKFYEYIVSLGEFQHYNYIEIQSHDELVYVLLPISLFKHDVEHLGETITSTNMEYYVDYVVCGYKSDLILGDMFTYKVYSDGEFRNTTKEEQIYIDGNLEIESMIINWHDIADRKYPKIDLDDWKENHKRTQRAILRMNEHNNIQETFEEWLSMRLQNRIGNKIGRGSEGSVYDFGNNNKKVIKIATVDLSQQYNLLNKNIKGFVKIYHIGFIEPPVRFMNSERTHVILSGESKIKSFSTFNNTSQDIYIKEGKVGYVIMEKVDTSVLSEMHSIREMLYTKLFETGDIQNSLGNLSISHDPFLRANTLFHLFKYVKSNYGLLLHYLKNYDFPELVYEMLEVFDSVSKVYPSWTDIHTGQFGRNRKGELVVFDVSNNTENVFGFNTDIDIHKHYPTPKNLIRENKELTLKDVPSDVKNAYYNFILTNKTVQEENEEQFNQEYSDPEFNTNVYLLDLKSGNLAIINSDANLIDIVKRYDYMIKVRWQDYGGYGTTYFVYHQDKFQQITPDDGYVDSLEILDGVSMTEIEYEFDVISKFDYNDWLKNKKRTTQAIFRMNESRNQSGLDNIPNELKQAFLKIIPICMSYNTHIWKNFPNVNFAEEIYLFATNITKYPKYKYFVKSKVKLIESVLDVNDVYFYAYEENSKKFTQVSDISNDLKSILNDMDELSRIEDDGLIYIFDNDNINNLRNNTIKSIFNINESNSYNNIDSDVKNAFIKYLQTDNEWSYFNKIYLTNGNPPTDEYDDDLFMSYMYLFDISNEDYELNIESGLEVKYIIKIYYQDNVEHTRYFVAYDDFKKEFVDIIDDDNGKYDKLLDDDNQMEGVSNYITPLIRYEYDDWLKTREMTGRAVLKMNEEIDIFGVDSERVIPKSLDDIPIKVKNAYINFIQTEMRKETDWYKKRNIHNIQESVIYLIDSVDLYIIGKDNVEKYNFLIKKYNFKSEGNIPVYYVYSEKFDKFLDTAKDIGYEHTYSNQYDIYTQYYKHDKYSKLEDSGLIAKYTYIDWQKHIDNTHKAMLKMNQ